MNRKEEPVWQKSCGKMLVIFDEDMEHYAITEIKEERIGKPLTFREKLKYK